MALTTVDQLILAHKQTPTYTKVANASAQSAGAFFTLWVQTGSPVGVAPSSGVAGNTLTSATAGAIPFVDPSSGLTYLVQANLNLNFGGGTIYLYDRLWHNSGLSATVTTAQTVNSVALPSRCPVITDPSGETFDTLGYGVEAWVDIIATMGAGTVTPTISYTDEAGNAGSVGSQMAWVTAASINRCFPFSRAAGDRGVRSVQSYTSTATQTSGTFSLVLRRRIAVIPQVAAGVIGPVDWGALGAVVPNGACLEVLVQSTVTNAIGVDGAITLAQG